MAGNKTKETLKAAGWTAAGWTAAVLAVEHLVIPAIFHGPTLEDTLANRVDSVAVGHPFNAGDSKHPGNGLRIEKLNHPNPAAVEAAWYNAYENNGGDPTKPKDRTRAAIACSTLILNGGHLSKAETDAWSTAQRNNGQNGDHNLADQQYAAAADACAADVTSMFGGAHPATQIEVPVALN